MKPLFTKQQFKRNRFFYIGGAIYLVIALAISICLLRGVYSLTLTTDTAKSILSTLMGVSGSIIGFLVIYLSIALESLKRHYGRHAMPVFRRDPIIWILCVFFVYVILLSLFAFLKSDMPGPVWLIAFNLACFSFGVGITIIVPVGILILNRTDSASHIGQLIRNLRTTDFREVLVPNHRLGPMFWTLNENPRNPVDQLSGILFHNINEGNSRVVANTLMELFKKVKALIEAEKGKETAKVVLRYLDLLLMAFDQAKPRNDEFTIKITFEGMKACSELIAYWRMGPKIVERLFEIGQTMTQYLIERELEQLTYEAFWMYYHVSRPQLLNNLPPDEETWNPDEDGDNAWIPTEQAWANQQRFEAVDAAVTFRLKELIERTFHCENGYITENAVRTMSNFIEMLIFENGIPPFAKNKIGGMQSYEASECIKTYIKRTEPPGSGYLQLHIGTSNLLTALKENSKFSQTLYNDSVYLYHFIIENGRLNIRDLEKIGGLGRLIIANSPQLSGVVDMVRSLLEVNKAARIWILRELKGHLEPREEKDLQAQATLAQHDLKSWATMASERAPNSLALQDVIKLFQL